MADSQTNLAEQALDNLVNQFARPLDFLRELVQNSIDAGSPRIEVTIDYDPPKPGQDEGITTISVDDWGEGMDEAIIDSQLTRLFSSNKEGDLTKIGKFGIGFTSIFAIQPELVQLKTGKHGENWELLFHTDRSYNRKSIDEPIDGTKIKLFKRMEPAVAKKFVEEARFILTYWCEHSNVPVQFWDRTDGETVQTVDHDDPFAAFSEVDTAPTGTGPESVNRPLDAADAELSVHHVDGDVEVVLGIGPNPLYGYYNGGLTLLRTRNLDSLEKFAAPLQHLSFKVKNDALEHTLTRDNVLFDTHWERAMLVVMAARLKLVEALLAKLATMVTEGRDPSRVQGFLAQLCDQQDVQSLVAGRVEAPMFLSVLGKPLTLAAVSAQRAKLQAVLVWEDADGLAAGIDEAGYHVLLDTPECRSLVKMASSSGWLGGSVQIAVANAVFLMPDVVDPTLLDDAERKLLANTAELLSKACGRRLRSVRLGDLGGQESGSREALCIDGATATGVHQRPSKGLGHLIWSWMPTLLKFRHLLINRHHPLFRAQLLASTEDPWLAAAGLASAVLHVEDIEPDRVHRFMLTLAHNRLVLN